MSVKLVAVAGQGHEVEVAREDVLDPGDGEVAEVKGAHAGGACAVLWHALQAPDDGLDAAELAEHVV